MGCFTVLKNRRKKRDRSANLNPADFIIENPASSLRSLHSAPPSFKNRTKFEGIDHAQNGRTCVQSAPSSLIIHNKKEDKFQKKVLGESHPLPLPLPVLKHAGSFNSNHGSDQVPFSGPLPLPPLHGLRYFSFDEILNACNNFSPERCIGDGLSTTTYRASFGEDSGSSKAFTATVVRLRLSKQGYKEFMNEINKIKSLQHPQLCKLIGFHAREGSDQWMLVFERLYHGSLDELLYGRSAPPMDWSTRIKVALCVAQGLAFFHEEGPFQAMYNELRSMHIQIDKDFSAKLSGFGAGICDAEASFSSSSVHYFPELITCEFGDACLLTKYHISFLQASANLSPETVERGLVTPKSNVWSFGIILLELLTGCQNLDTRHQTEERNLAKWAKTLLSDDCRLSLIMDPSLKGRYPAKAAKLVIEIVVKCLDRESSLRPTMRAVVKSLLDVQDIKLPSRFPLQEPISTSQTLNLSANQRQAFMMTRSPSLNGVPSPALAGVGPPLSPSPPVPCRVKPLVSPLRPLSLPPGSCASTVSFEDNVNQDALKLISPGRSNTGVAGF